MNLTLKKYPSHYPISQIVVKVKSYPTAKQLFEEPARKGK